MHYQETDWKTHTHQGMEVSLLSERKPKIQLA